MSIISILNCVYYNTRDELHYMIGMEELELQTDAYLHNLNIDLLYSGIIDYNTLVKVVYNQLNSNNIKISNIEQTFESILEIYQLYKNPNHIPVTLYDTLSKYDIVFRQLKQLPWYDFTLSFFNYHLSLHIAKIIKLSFDFDINKISNRNRYLLNINCVMPGCYTIKINFI